MTTFRQLLQGGVTKVRAGDAQGALLDFRNALDVAIAEGNVRHIKLAAHNAAIVCENAQRMSQACDYYRASLAHNSNDLLALFELGELSSRMGASVASEGYFKECLARSAQNQDKELLELLATKGFAPK